MRKTAKTAATAVLATGMILSSASMAFASTNTTEVTREQAIETTIKALAEWGPMPISKIASFVQEDEADVVKTIQTKCVKTPFLNLKMKVEGYSTTTLGEPTADDKNKTPQEQLQEKIADSLYSPYLHQKVTK